MSSDRLALDPLAASGTPEQRLLARVAELEAQIARIGLPANQRQTITNSSVSMSGATSSQVLGTMTFQTEINTPLLIYAQTFFTGGTSTAVNLYAKINGTDWNTLVVSTLSSSYSNVRTQTAPLVLSNSGTSWQSTVSPSGNVPGGQCVILLPAGTHTVEWRFAAVNTISLANTFITAALDL